jgi:hypothetical protein
MIVKDANGTAKIDPLMAGLQRDQAARGEPGGGVE